MAVANPADHPMAVEPFTMLSDRTGVTPSMRSNTASEARTLAVGCQSNQVL